MPHNERLEHIKAQFLDDTANHKMEIIQDNGVYRHVRFMAPGSSCHMFDLVTYPNYLVYSGDMGCFVFSRIEDMFSFFRTTGDELKVNTGYWSEKIKAFDRSSNSDKEWDISLHKSWVTERFNEWKAQLIDDGDAHENDFRPIWKDIKNRVLNPDDERDALNILENYDFEVNDSKPFENWYESYDANQMPQRLIWCLWAINWGVKQYNKHHEDAHARRAKIAKEQEERESLYIVYRDDVTGAPFKIGQKVRVGEQTGEVLFLDYSGGCGESYPDDPMISVNIDDGYSEGGQGMFWKEELEAV